MTEVILNISKERRQMLWDDATNNFLEEFGVEVGARFEPLEGDALAIPTTGTAYFCSCNSAAVLLACVEEAEGHTVALVFDSAVGQETYVVVSSREWED